MTISGLTPYSPAIPARPASPPPSQTQPAEVQAKAQVGTTVKSSSLWQVLTPEEKAFFLGASAASALGYGPNGASRSASAPSCGQNLDVMA